MYWQYAGPRTALRWEDQGAKANRLSLHAGVSYEGQERNKRKRSGGGRPSVDFIAPVVFGRCEIARIADITN